MALQKFTFENIEQIDDGSIALGVNQALRAAFHDCSDRPEVKKPRKVNLELAVTPVMDKGEFRYAKVQMVIKSSVPAKGIEVVMRPSSSDAALEFQPSCPENPDQLTFDQEGGDK